MRTLAPRIVFGISIMAALLPVACSKRHPVECDSACVAEVRRGTQYGQFAGTTEEQWQSAFQTANDELAKGDWSERLSEIQQEYCRTPGKVDFQKVKNLENDMLKKRSFEVRDKHIDIMASMAHPNDPSGIKALEQMRTEGMKDAILKIKIQQIMQACYVPASPARASAQ